MLNHLRSFILFLSIWLLLVPGVRADNVDLDQVRGWLVSLVDGGLSPSEYKKTVANVFYHSDVYRRAVLEGKFPASDKYVAEFLEGKKRLMQDVIQETNYRYRSATGHNIKGPVIPFDYNNILSDDDVILSSGPEGKRLEPIFNEALNDVVEGRTGNPFTAADRKRIDVNGLSWNMTNTGSLENFAHPEKYINPQSGFDNQRKLGSAGDKIFVAGFDGDGKLVRLSPNDATDAINSLKVDKPLNIPGVRMDIGSGAMTDFWRMADIHQIKFKGHLPPEDVAQFIRNQKYTERLVNNFNEIAAANDPKLAQKYQDFIELSAKIRKETTIKGVAELLEKAHGVKIVVNGQLGAEGMEKLRELMQKHQQRQLAMMPELVGSVTKAESGPMMDWIKNNLNRRNLLRKQLALTYAPYSSKEMGPILQALDASDLKKTDVTWLRQVLTEDTEQIRRYARALQLRPEEFVSRVRLNGNNLELADYIVAKFSKATQLVDQLKRTKAGRAAYSFARTATGRALNLDVVLEGPTSSKLIMGSMMLLAASRGYDAANRHEGMKAVGMAFFEMIPFVAATLRLSEGDAKLALKEFLMDVLPPLALANIGVMILDYSGKQAVGLLKQTAWDQLVQEALVELQDDDFEKTTLGYYKFKNRQAYFDYINDVAPAFGRIIKLHSMIQPEVDARMTHNKTVQNNNAALHTINYLEKFDIDTLRRQVLESGIPAKGAAPNTVRVASKIILESEQIRKELYQVVLGEFLTKIEEEYNRRKRELDDDFDPSAIVQKARDILRAVYDAAVDRGAGKQALLDSLKSEYVEYIRILINHPTDGKDLLTLEQELLQIIDEFKVFVENLFRGQEMFEEGAAMTLRTHVFGGPKGNEPSSEVLLGDSFRIGINALVDPKRKGERWTAYYYIEDSFGTTHLIGTKSLNASEFNPGNDGLWAVRGEDDGAHLHIKGDVLNDYFLAEQTYSIRVVLAFGAWSDPIAELGVGVLEYPGDRTHLFRGRAAFVSPIESISVVRPKVRLKIPKNVSVSDVIQTKLYMPLPSYAVDYKTSAQISIQSSSVDSKELPELSTSNVSPLSKNKDQADTVEITSSDKVEAGRYTVVVSPRVENISDDYQPFTLFQSFDLESSTSNKQGDVELVDLRFSVDSDGASTLNEFSKGSSGYVLAKFKVAKEITNYDIVIEVRGNKGEAYARQTYSGVGSEDEVSKSLGFEVENAALSDSVIATLSIIPVDHVDGDVPGIFIETKSIPIKQSSSDEIIGAYITTDTGEDAKFTTQDNLLLHLIANLKGKGFHNLSVVGGPDEINKDISVLENSLDYTDSIPLGKFDGGNHTLVVGMKYQGGTVEEIINFKVDSDSVFSLRDFSVSSVGGGAPNKSKDMIASAELMVGEYEGFVSLEWERKSDGVGGGEIEIINVGKNHPVRIKKELPSKKSTRGANTDSIMLTVSDGEDESYT